MTLNCFHYRLFGNEKRFTNRPKIKIRKKQELVCINLMVYNTSLGKPQTLEIPDFSGKGFGEYGTLRKSGLANIAVRENE